MPRLAFLHNHGCCHSPSLRAAFTPPPPLRPSPPLTSPRASRESRDPPHPTSNISRDTYLRLHSSFLSPPLTGTVSLLRNPSCLLYVRCTMRIVASANRCIIECTASGNGENALTRSHAAPRSNRDSPFCRCARDVPL